METLNNLQFMPIAWTIVLIAVAFTIIWFAVVGRKYRHADNTEMIDKETGLISSDYINTHKEMSRLYKTITFRVGNCDEVEITTEFLDNTQVVYIMYYKELSPRRLIGHIPGARLVVLTGLDDLNYKVYLYEEIFPCKFNSQVTGYIEDDIFYVISVTESVDIKDLPVEIGKTEEELSEEYNHINTNHVDLNNNTKLSVD